jgi:hypothetical protein
VEEDRTVERTTKLGRERGGSSAFIPQTTRVCNGRDNIRSTETPRSICLVDICVRGSVCRGESPQSITHSQTWEQRRPHTRFIAHLTSSQDEAARHRPSSPKVTQFFASMAFFCMVFEYMGKRNPNYTGQHRFRKPLLVRCQYHVMRHAGVYARYHRI